VTTVLLVAAGVALFPVLAAAGFYGWRGLRTANRWLRAYFNELRLDKKTKRAHFGSAAACSRRIWAFPLPGSAALVIAAGVNPDDKRAAYDALMGVLSPGENDRPAPARINPKWLRRGKPTEPTVTFDEED
jgi:hypothetical protein